MFYDEDKSQVLGSDYLSPMAVCTNQVPRVSYGKRGCLALYEYHPSILKPMAVFEIPHVYIQKIQSETLQHPINFLDFKY